MRASGGRKRDDRRHDGGGPRTCPLPGSSVAGCMTPPYIHAVLDVWKDMMRKSGTPALLLGMALCFGMVADAAAEGRIDPGELEDAGRLLVANGSMRDLEDLFAKRRQAFIDGARPDNRATRDAAAALFDTVLAPAYRTRIEATREAIARDLALAMPHARIIEALAWFDSDTGRAYVAFKDDPAVADTIDDFFSDRQIGMTFDMIGIARRVAAFRKERAKALEMQQEAGEAKP